MQAQDSRNVTITVDPEFKALIPSLTDEEFAGLERSILEEGVREPIVTWQGVIVDGHNRYEIATAHGLDFDTVEYDFPDKASAKTWMIRNQLSRRNISTYQRSILALKMRDIVAEDGKRRQGKRTDIPVKLRECLDSAKREAEISAARKAFSEGGRRDEATMNAADTAMRAARKDFANFERQLEKHIYFARVGDVVKVGSSEMPESRIEQFKTSYPDVELLEDIKFGEGAVKHERAIAKRFAHCRVGNETYRPSDAELEEMVAFTKKAASRNNETTSIIAKIAGVSASTIEHVEKIEKEASEQVREQLRNGEISINAAYKKLRKEQQRAEREERKSFDAPAEFPDGMCSLYVSDIRDGLPEVADCSIDAIITDPPYPREYIGLYGDLAKVAARVLKPGGSLLAMAGQSYLPEVIAAMEGNGMEYHWCLSYLTPGGQAPHLFARNVNTFWKPVLWFVKGGYEGDCIGDVLKSEVNDNDKRFHHWGQSESGMADIVERFTDPGQTILDPFLGGGTTGVVALSMGRAFVGCELDPYTLDLAETRIRDSYGR